MALGLAASAGGGRRAGVRAARAALGRHYSPARGARIGDEGARAGGASVRMAPGLAARCVAGRALAACALSAGGRSGGIDRSLDEGTAHPWSARARIGDERALAEREARACACRRALQ